MSFSKTSYRSRRSKGLRGQGDKHKPKVTPGEGKHMVRGPKGFISVSRKQARQRLRSKVYDQDKLVIVGREKQTIVEDKDGNIIERKLGKVIKKKSEDKQGKHLTAKGVKHTTHIPEEGSKPTSVGHFRKYEGPLYPPETTNKERNIRRRIMRDKIRDQRRKADAESI